VAATSDTPFRLHSVAFEDSNIVCDLSIKKVMSNKTNRRKQRNPPFAAANHMTQSAPHFVSRLVAIALTRLVRVFAGRMSRNARGVRKHSKDQLTTRCIYASLLTPD
jgi:hypothetical protein